MADLDKTVQIIFNGVDRASRQARRVSSAIDDLGNRARTVTSPLASVTAGLLKMQGVLAAVSAATAAYVSKQAADFESGLTEISKTTDITGDNLDALGGEIQKLAVETGVGTRELNDIAAAAGRMGVRGVDNILAFTSTVAKIGETTDVAGEQAATMFSRILELSGEAPANIETLASVIVELGNNSAASEAEILKMTNEISRAASEFELSSDEAAALGAALAATGARAEGAATAVGRSLRAIQSAIVNGGEEMKRLQQLTGLTGDQLEETFAQDAQRVFKLFLDGISESSRTTQEELDAFGLATEETLKALGPLVQRTENYTEKQRLASEQVKNATALNDEFRKLLEDVNKQASRTAAQFDVTAQTIGAQFAPEVNNALQATTRLLGSFEEAAGEDNALTALIDYLASNIAGVTEDLNDMADVLPQALQQVETQELIDGFGNIKDALGELFEGIDLTTADGLADVIQELVDTGGTLADTTAGMIRGLRPFLRAIVNGISDVNDFGSNVAETAGHIAGVAAALDKAIPLLQGLGGIIGALTVGKLARDMAALSAGSSAAATSVSGLAGKFSRLAKIAGKGGLAGAVGLATFELGKQLEINDRLIPGTESLGTKLFELTHEETNLEGKVTAATLGLTEQSNKTGSLTEKTKQLVEAKRAGVLTEEELGGVMAEVNQYFAERGLRLDANTGELKELNETENKTVERQRELVKVGAQHVEVLRNANGEITGYRDAQRGIQDEYAKTAEQAAKAGRETDKFRLKMEEIASNERIKTLEARVELDIAQAQEKTKRVEAMFDSLDNSISTTGDTIESSLGVLAETDFSVFGDLGKQNLIRKVVEDANKRQNELIQAQIDLIEERTRQLRENDGSIPIEISASELEPDLESILFKILERIQVRANSEQAEFLIGI